MANEVKLPRLGQGMESGTIVKWLKTEGDRVEKGEPLYELDTDKVTQEVEADFSGVLLRIAVAEGEVDVGKTIAVIGEEGETVAATEVEDTEVEETAVEETPVEEAPEQAAPSRTDGRVKASPLARRIARERGVDVAQLTGTGPEGRIVAEDVERAAVAPAAAPGAPAAPAEVETRKLSSLRRTIAKRMTEAWEAPAFQITMSADMTRAIELRERYAELQGEEGPKPSFSDILTKVSALALMRHRAVNARFAGDAVELHGTADIGIAVATERGLLVPVLRGVERKPLPDVAAETRALVERARSGKLEASDFEGGTFTISNLGMYGVEQFVAVLNPPQAAILAVGAIEERPIVRDGELDVRPMMTMTLTCDHRAIDGATAAEFLADVRALLEEPGLAL